MKKLHTYYFWKNSLIAWSGTAIALLMLKTFSVGMGGSFPNFYDLYYGLFATLVAILLIISALLANKWASTTDKTIGTSGFCGIGAFLGFTIYHFGFSFISLLQ